VVEEGEGEGQDKRELDGKKEELKCGGKGVKRSWKLGEKDTEEEIEEGFDCSCRQEEKMLEKTTFVARQAHANQGCLFATYRLAAFAHVKTRTSDVTLTDQRFNVNFETC
jgi:hypothetical protein